MFTNLSYLAGFIVGILLVVVFYAVLCLIAKKKGKSQDGEVNQYDERQLLARGRAAQMGFCVTVLYMFCVGIVKPDVSQDLLMYFGGCLGLAAFAITCIIRDAYFPVSSRPAVMILVLIAGAVVNLLFGITHLSSVEAVYRLNLYVGIMLVVILLVLVGKVIYEKIGVREEEE